MLCIDFEVVVDMAVVVSNFVVVVVDFVPSMVARSFDFAAAADIGFDPD